jgi:hypothetical protein
MNIGEILMEYTVQLLDALRQEGDELADETITGQNDSEREIGNFLTFGGKLFATRSRWLLQPSFVYKTNS